MTNATIILNESFRLMDEGILKGSGQFGIIETDEGKKRVEFPEAIHTFNGWKSLGYSVKKGEKSKIRIKIWKYTEKQIETENENEESDTVSNMFMKLSAFFTAAQVEKIKA